MKNSLAWVMSLPLFLSLACSQGDVEMSGGARVAATSDSAAEPAGSGDAQARQRGSTDQEPASGDAVPQSASGDGIGDVSVVEEQAYEETMVAVIQDGADSAFEESGSGDSASIGEDAGTDANDTVSDSGSPSESGVDDSASSESGADDSASSESGADDSASNEPEQPQALAFLCLSNASILKAGDSQSFSWQLPYDDSTMSVEIYSPDMVTDVGSIMAESANTVRYTAPAMASESFAVRLRAMADNGDEAECALSVQAQADIGVEDDGFLDGLVGNVFQLAPNTNLLPDFSQMQALSSIVVGNLDIPNRAFDTGFPGVPDLFEWFGIQFSGRINVAADGWYDFKISSDDGSKLFIDGVMVIDNDGTHAVREKTGRVYLMAGAHDITIDYFQGPRYHIALQLFWMQPGDSAYQIISPEVFDRPQP